VPPARPSDNGFSALSSTRRIENAMSTDWTPFRPSSGGSIADAGAVRGRARIRPVICRSLPVPRRFIAFVPTPKWLRCLVANPPLARNCGAFRLVSMPLDSFSNSKLHYQ